MKQVSNLTKDIITLGNELAKFTDDLEKASVSQKLKDKANKAADTVTGLQVNLTIDELIEGKSYED